MLAITTTFEHIGHWIKMRQSLARFSEPESSRQIRSWADFITTTPVFRFSVHTGGLAPWQIFRVRTYIDSNLHRTIHNRDLSTIACRSPAHFSHKFKLAVCQAPHCYLVRRRPGRARHLMNANAENLSGITVSASRAGQGPLFMSVWP